MAQIGQLLLEYTAWLKRERYTWDVEEEVQRKWVEAFLRHAEHKEWMPTTGAEQEEAHPEPVDDEGIRVDEIIEYCEGVALNEAANASARLKAAEVVIRWFDAVQYDNTLRELDAKPEPDHVKMFVRGPDIRGRMYP